MFLCLSQDCHKDNNNNNNNKDLLESIQQKDPNKGVCHKLYSFPGVKIKLTARSAS